MRRLCGIIIVIAFLLSCCIFTASAQEPDPTDYAPILYFESEETCFPVDVAYHIDNSYLYQLTDTGPELKNANPTEELLDDFIDSNSYYLDNQKGTITDTGIITDYQSKISQLGYTVYAYVKSDGMNTYLQYWFFYAFNQGELNQHEGDWEMVQVVFSGDQPTEVMYSQHYNGQRATWEQVEREDNHIKVYVARGSHASYLRSYSGKFGISSDSVGSNGKVLQYTDYTLEVLESQPWLEFAGRWGWSGESQSQAAESALLGQVGPEGPMYRQGGTMWNDPNAWSASLFQADDNIFLVEWLLYNFVLIFILLTILSIGIMVFFIYRRKKKYGLGPRIISMLYISGTNRQSIGNILCILGIIITLVGLVLPWYAVNVNVTVPDQQTTGLIDIVKIDGLNGIQITLPESSGPQPLGTFDLPFSFILAVGIILLILSTIGIAQSKKLGRKYITRGIRLFIPFILVIIIIMAMAMIIPLMQPGELSGTSTVSDAMNAISAAPFGGETTLMIPEVTGSLYLSWGVGIGLYLLVVAGIVFLIAGFMEISAKTTFFEQKEQEVPQKQTKSEEEKKPPVPLETTEEKP